MNGVQRAIKYAAMAFALLLAAFILTVIIRTGLTLIGLTNNDTGSRKSMDFSNQYTDVTDLNIKTGAAELTIIPSDGFAVEAKNVSEEFACENREGTLIIEDKSNFHQAFGFLENNTHPEIILRFPRDFIAGSAEIEAGAGKVSIEGLSARGLVIKMGAGKLTCRSLSADHADIQGGAGSLEIKGATIDGLTLTAGVGEATFEGLLTGDNEFNCGVGKVTALLNGNPDDYQINITSGIGAVKINGQKYNDDVTINENAKNTMRVKGGIGEIDLNFHSDES